MTKHAVMDNKGYVELVDSMGDDLRIVNSARVSFNVEKEEFGERDETLIKYLLENKHTSPLEHVVFTFLVKVPLFIRSQWMRHRTWSFNEVSRRYTSEDMEFYIPKSFRKQSENNRQASTDEEIKEIYWFGATRSIEELITEHSENAKSLYNTLLENGVAREQARMVLPQNLYTKYYATVDLHNLLHFIDIRNHDGAQYEMRLYAQKIQQLAESVVPGVMKIWKSIKKATTNEKL